MGTFVMPSLGADMEAGTLVEWLVRPGDTVRRGDVVAVVETQKGAIEIECFEAGTVRDLLAEVGTQLPVGAPLALIGAADTGPPARAPAAAAPQAPPPAALPPASAPAPRAAAPVPAGGVAASPAARVRAGELGLDLATLKGSGPGGAVLLADVEARRGTPTAAASRPDEMRKAIAAAMTRSKQTIPHFYLSQTIDVQPALDWLALRNDGRPPSERLLPGAVFLRAAVRAAGRVASLNGRWEDGAFHPSAAVHAGMAVALRGGGLVAPAILDADSMTLDQTMSAMRDVVTRARAGRLRGSEMTAGTITVSSLGETGAEAMSGVIFPPQVALVGLGALQLRPWVVAGAVVPRQVLTVTLSADHRVSDGRQAARFLAEFEALVATPEDL